MQTPVAAATTAAAATAARPIHRGYVACMWTALAALLGHAAGAELSEDELLGELRGEGLITYPSPLLAFLEKYPDLFKDEVLPSLDPPARASLARTGRAMRETVCPLAIFPSGPPRGLNLGPVRLFKIGPGRHCPPHPGT